MSGRRRVDHAVTSGTFSLDGETFDVDNNVWVVGDDDECLVVDPAHDVSAVASLVGARKVVGVVCTHGHDDHCRYAPEAGERFQAPVLLHPDDEPLWRMTHPHTTWDVDLADGQVIPVAGMDVQVLHTPGHAPGAVCLYVPDLGVVLTGDTLFQGGPGATGGRSFSDFPTIIESIRERVLSLPPDTVVLTGHGDRTTVAAEAGHLEEWVARGF
ncbi:MAG TPA: MBL fold metallo-hydrolase [Jiangellales bacterium]|nr:MBL fold metallo-hydrolase [Jiangellales bacterium]